MKYLKSYNESNNEYDIQEIRDILLELSDEGFNISVSTLYRETINVIITLNDVNGNYLGYRKMFTWDRVSDVLDRLRNYMMINNLIFTTSEIRSRSNDRKLLNFYKIPENFRVDETFEIERIHFQIVRK